MDFPVTVNDHPAELPVVDVAVTPETTKDMPYVLDDPEYPLLVAVASSTSSGHEQVIKIY